MYREGLETPQQVGLEVYRARQSRRGIGDPIAAALSGERRGEHSRGRVGVSIPKRVAVIDVSHWHSAYDAAYLRVLRDLGCDIARGLRPRRADR